MIIDIFNNASEYLTAVMALYLAGEKKLWKIALILAVLISFSRLYLYVHYPTDVLGGIVTGCIAGYIGYKLTVKLAILSLNKKVS